MLSTKPLVIESRLYSHPILDSDQFVIEQYVPMMTEHYHKCLFDCPRPLDFVQHTLGISKNQINEYQIGYCDRSLCLDFPPPKSIDGIKFRGSLKRLALVRPSGHEAMRGCLTLPISDGDGPIGMFGLRYERTRRLAEPMAYSNFGAIPIFSLQGMGKVALKCHQPFDVIAFDEHGYHNGFAELDSELSEVSCDTLKQLEVTVLVYFTDPMGANFNVHEAKYIAERYGIKLCEVNLPFKVMHLGKWDDFQWHLFDNRLTRALNDIGVRNERYQS
jgi:hypothetical protein